tara:strand:- start:576 stop:863 length:288 start_codon:yes stop_codon:yes gene_type:complete
MIYGYQQKEAIYEEYKGSYTENGKEIMISKEYGWNHGLSDVVNNLLKAGLTIECFKEYNASPYDVFPGLVKNKEAFFEMPAGLYPLLFEIKAVKK